MAPRKKKLRLRKDKKGRYIKRGRKKIYFKGSLESIKRYIKKLFDKQKETKVVYAQAPKIEETQTPQSLPVTQEPSSTQELAQKSRANLVSIASTLGIRGSYALTKNALIERILESGWTPTMVIPEVTSKLPTKKEVLISKYEELSGNKLSATKKQQTSIPVLIQMIDDIEKKMVESPSFVLEEKKTRGRPRKVKPIEPIREPSPPPPTILDEPKGLVRTVFGMPPPPAIFNLEKTYIIPYLENSKYKRLLTGIKDPSETDIFSSQAKNLDITPDGKALLKIPTKLNTVQISALSQLVGIPKGKFKKDELIALVKKRLDEGVLDPDNRKIIDEAKDEEAEKPVKIDTDAPIEPTSPPPEMTGEGKVKDEGISNFKIDEIMGGFPEYLGTIGRDQIHTQILPKVKQRSKGGFIINTEPINKRGEHWQAVYFDGTDGGEYEINFFDSYADKPDEKILEDLKALSERLNCKLLMKFKENRVKLQNERSSNCGWFCIRFLTDRFRGKPFVDASGFSDVVKGEKAIERFKMQHGGFIQYLPSFGKLVPEKIKQFVKEKLFFPPNRLPPSAQKVLDQYKDAEITGISVQREPVNSMITKFLNFISLGKFGAIQKKLGYDRFYHLSMNVATTKGRLKIEKNARINIIPVKGIAIDNYGIAGVPKGLTVESMLEKARKSMGDTQFFQYDALKNNCQLFILGILKANIPSLSKDTVDFIYQPVEELVKGLPEYVKKIASFATDTGAKAQELIEGGKNKK